jgi:hypothetical protein
MACDYLFKYSMIGSTQFQTFQRVLDLDYT